MKMVIKESNLTEQYIKGELESGLYFLKCKQGEVVAYWDIDKNCFYAYNVDFVLTTEILEVLAKVPTYEEHQALKAEKETAVNLIGSYIKQITALKAENKRLKEKVQTQIYARQKSVETGDRYCQSLCDCEKKLAKYKEALERAYTALHRLSEPNAINNPDFQRDITVECELISQALNQEKGKDDE